MFAVGCIVFFVLTGGFHVNPEPETRNPKPETRNPKPETRNPKARYSRKFQNGLVILCIIVGNTVHYHVYFI